MPKNFRFAANVVALAASILLASSAHAARPKLVLALVVDQFRGDYIQRFDKQLLAARKGEDVGGLKYLVATGAFYPWGQYDILQSMTCPGHATILSGAYPYQMGIPTNLWYDRELAKSWYCAEDAAYPLVGTAGKYAATGASPKSGNGTTVGDEMKGAGYSSRVVTISQKDRSAIYLGGKRADLAIWLDDSTMQWVSSKYYVADGKLPDWLTQLSAETQKNLGKKYAWKGPGFTHVNKIGTDEHALGSPLGAELTTEAAIRAFDAFKLGTGKDPDLFGVSYSSYDYIGHEYGTNSPELENATASQDREIARLLNHIRKKIPLKDVLIVFTSDHGVSPAPAYTTAHKLGGGHIDNKEVADKIGEKLTDKFGKASSPWVAYARDLNFAFDRKVLADRKVSLTDAEEVARAVVAPMEGVNYVFTSSDYAARKLPPGIHERQIMKTYVPGRSGDVIIIPKPFWIKKGDFATHMTGYSYDRTVPIIFAGPGIRPGRYAQRAEVIDIAPTLSYLLGTIAPTLSEGRVLHEALSADAGAPAPTGGKPKGGATPASP